MANVIPEKGINFKVYLEGGELLGLAEGTIPVLEAMTSEVKGAGISGAIESIVLGHFNSTTFSLTWRSVTASFMKLAQHRTHEIELYSSIQMYDAGLGEYKTVQLYVFLKADTKTFTPGNLVVGDNMDTQCEFEVRYMKVELDGKERIEMDKQNMIYKVDGVDYVAQVRTDLGGQ